MAVYEHECEWCGRPFTSNRRDSKFDKAKCRKQASLKRRRERNSFRETQETADSPDSPDSSLESVISRQIEGFGLSGSWRAAEAVELARAMDRPDTGAAKAALSRQLTALMEKLEGQANRVGDPVDEVMLHADRLRRGDST